MKTHTKMIAASLSLMATAQAFAGVGGLNVQSNLGEPFSGSIVVTGREAEALIKSGSVSVSGNGIQGTVVPQGNDKALIRLRSSSAINDPVVNLTVKAGNQTRQYTVMVNPANYRPRSTSKAPTTRNHTGNIAPIQQTHKRAETTVPTPQGPFGDDYNPNRQTGNMQPESNTERVRKPSATQQQRTRSARPRYYRAHRGESLASIAARYRPHGMSVQRAMRALVAANPRAFRNGNPNAMYRNVTLYIPTASQWYAYSNRRIHRTHSPRLAAMPNTNKPALVESTTQPAQTGVAPTQTGTVANTQQTPPAQPQTAPTPPKSTPPTPVNKPQESATPPAPPQAEAPSKPATTPAFASDNKPAVDNKPKEPEVASTPTTPASAAPAVAPPVTASAETASMASTVVVAASQASQASAVVASAPPKPKKRPPMPVEEPVEEEGFDLLGLALPVVGGLLALGTLGGGAYLLNRRRKANAAAADDDEFDDEDVSFDDNADDEWAVTPSSAKTTTQTADVDAEWDLPEETTSSFETSDDLFDLPAEEPAASVQAASNTSNESFDLDEFEPDNLTDFSVDTTPEEDFDWAVSEEKATPVADTIETEEESWEVDTDLLSKPAVAAAAATAATAAVAAKADDWLDDTFLSEPEPAAVETVPAAVETADEEEWLLDDSFTVSETPAVTESTPVADVAEEDWLSDSFAVEESAPVAPVSTTETVDDLFNLDLPSETTTAPAAQIADSLDTLDITLPETEVDFTPSAPVETTSHDDILDFGLDLPTAAVAGAAATAVVATTAAADNLDMSFDVDMNLDTPSSPANSLDEFNLDLSTETVQAAPSTEISLDDFGLDLPTETATPEVEIATLTDAPEISVDDFGLDLPTIEEPVINLDAPTVETADFNLNDIPSVTEPDISLDTPDLAVDDFGLDLPAEPATDISLDDFGLDVAVEEPQINTPVADEISMAFNDDLAISIDEPVQAAPAADNSLSFVDDDLSLSMDEPVQTAPAVDNSLSFADDLSLGLDEPVTAAPTLAVEEPVDTASWDVAAAPTEVGFVSESVDMTAPMEARLELAKMYLEIDDAVAARETLRELINESSGDVQHQAKQLLNELGG